jgi:predicted phosphohydrolase
MKLIWVSDIHLNFLKELHQRQNFYKKLKGDAVVISGDIAESDCVVRLVEEMENHIQLPIYFVLGNHDFYGSNIASVKRSVKPLCYLPKSNYVALSASTALLGVDGWGDCRNGDYWRSRLTMSDWIYIEDLRKGYDQGMDFLKDALQSLADKDAQALKRRVHRAIAAGYQKIIIVTHVPPFEEAALHAGRKSTPDGLPFFSSQILGTTILPIALKNPEVDFLWLSGHTHSRAVYKPCENMTVKVADAQYYHPQIEEIIEC